MAYLQFTVYNVMLLCMWCNIEGNKYGNVQVGVYLYYQQSYMFCILIFLFIRETIGSFQIKKCPPPHRGCQNLLQNLPGNPDCKIVSKCGNPDDFCKIYLEIMEFVTKIWVWLNFIKNIWKWCLKLTKFSGIPETTTKAWNSDLLYGGRHLLSESTHFCLQIKLN